MHLAVTMQECINALDSFLLPHMIGREGKGKTQKHQHTEILMIRKKGYRRAKIYHGSAPLLLSC